MMNVIDPRDNIYGIPNGQIGSFTNKSHRTAKEFLTHKIEELTKKVRDLENQMLSAKQELYEHEKDLNKLVS